MILEVLVLLESLVELWIVPRHVIEADDAEVSERAEVQTEGFEEISALSHR